MPCRRAAMQAHEGGYYVALDLHDRPGEVAAVARVLAEEKISIESIVQRGPRWQPFRRRAPQAPDGAFHPHHPRDAGKCRCGRPSKRSRTRAIARENPG